ncbi:hypothetical protein M0805_002019 [Coniferiporia weirii]|nr:hypothetical protein M0805_002019 [Coniferiporia weirii]
MSTTEFTDTIAPNGGDNWQRKLYVFVAWAFDTAHQVCILKPLYVLTMGNFVSLYTLVTVGNTTVGVILFAAFTDGLVQILFVTRIWHLSNGNKYLTSGISILVVAQFITTCAYFAMEYKLTEFGQLTITNNIERAALAMIVVTDVAIASVLVYLLYSSRSGFRRTDTVINRLIVYTVNTGLITALCAVAALITSLACPTTFLPDLFLFMIPKLYVNSMLASLNSRDTLRTALASTGDTELAIGLPATGAYVDFSHYRSAGSDTLASYESRKERGLDASVSPVSGYAHS